MPSRKTATLAGSGSPSTGGPEYLVVGSLRRPHGLKGELVMEVLTDFPDRLGPDSKVYIGEKHQLMTIAGTRFHNEGLLIKFKNLDSPDEAGHYRNQLVYVPKADRPPLPSGHYYYHELMGFSVVDEHNNAIGQLLEILQTGANDVYVITRPDGNEVLLPAIPSVILAIDAEHRQIHVHLLDGLMQDKES
jgi:16S rRNA processing protein RimM